MRPWVEVGLLGVVVGSLGVARSLAAAQRALLPGEGGVLVAQELLVPAVAVGVLLLFGRRLLRADLVGAAAAMGALAGLGLVGHGLVPEQVPGVAVLLAAPLVGRILARHRPETRLLWAVAAVGLALFRWPVTRDAPPAALAGQAPQRLVLVTLDTFRADHLGKLGGAWFGVQTPHLDALAEQGLFFSEGVAPVPLTLPSHTAMLTGRLPEESGVLRNGHHVPDEVQTVAETLAAQGWSTGAFLGAAVLQRHGGLDQGFHHYDDLLGPRAAFQLGTVGRALGAAELLDDPEVMRPGDQVVARALDWLERQPGPTFLWVHLYDAHSPYEPPAPWDGLYEPDQPGVPGDPEQVRAIRLEARRLNPLVMVPGPTDLRPSLAAYAGEIAWVDHVVGELLAGLPADASLVVAADHGESLVEHGYMLNHGWLVNQPSVRVPLWVRAPAVPAGQQVDAPTPLTAVAPTVLALAGLPEQARDIGPSLLDRAAAPPSDEVLRMYGTTQQSRRIFSAHQQWRVGWRRGDEKWVMEERSAPQRFDLAADPGELTDTAPDHPDADLWAVRSREAIDALKAANKASRTAEGQVEALRALGYVE